MDVRIGDLGEFGLISKINEIVKKEGKIADGLSLGIGDDTASILPRHGYEILVTCDSMVEGRHFLLEKTNFFDLGRRAMAINISDIGAMGGRPLYSLISLGLKKEMLLKDIEDLYRGFLAELNPFGASIIGGNLTGTGNGIFIDITLIGEIESGKAIKRSGAKPGDVILVTGYPGQASAGLKVLLKSTGDPFLMNHPIVDFYLRPKHRAELGMAVAKAGLATAMIDISDGFLGDLGHICEESGVGAELFIDKIPINEQLKEVAQILGTDPREFFFGESDDYELIITCNPKDVKKISDIALDLKVTVTEVGRITESKKGIVFSGEDRSAFTAKRGSWDHFKD
ncbi:MAG: thiamine-phosphate kinase [Syntrophorhabdaceae bacterium]|nr:thiamine-phosphate kinase [Syntrophorhabdaceae bacterium]